MRAKRVPIPNMRRQALEQLRRNAAMLPCYVEDALIHASVVVNAIPSLIVLDGADLDRITNFKYSPYYAGTDIYSAIAADPVDENGRCDRLLAKIIHRAISADHKVILPHALARHSDSWLASATGSWAALDDRVYFKCHYESDERSWCEAFHRALGLAATAGSWEIGICSASSRLGDLKRTVASLIQSVRGASIVFTSALDGEGYLVWKP